MAPYCATPGMFSLIEKKAMISIMMAIGMMMNPISTIVLAAPTRKRSPAVLNIPASR